MHLLFDWQALSRFELSEQSLAGYLEVCPGRPFEEQTAPLTP